MTTSAQKPNPIIAKMANLMMLIETRIQQKYHPKERARFIAETAFELTHHEDHYFTGDQIEKIVKVMVQYHESGVNKWHIDIEHCTAEHIAITIDEGPKVKVPADIFVAAVVPINSAGSPAPLH